MATGTLRTRYEWLDLLASKISVFDARSIKQEVRDEVYRPEGGPSGNSDAFIFCNSADHVDAVARIINGLGSRKVPSSTIRKWLVDLTGRHTYGTFCELAAYGVLLDAGHAFDVQTRTSGTETLNPNGTELDGVLRLPEAVAFDIKAFGFHQYLTEKLAKRLTADLAPSVAIAEASWDAPIPLLEKLLGKQYPVLLAELKEAGKAIRGPMVLKAQAQRQAQFSEIELDPIALAEANSGYALTDAEQFTRHMPFVLILVIHPWFNGILHENFTGFTDEFAGAFAQKTFCDFEGDTRPAVGVTKEKAARLLSGILFVDVWQGRPASKPPRHRLLLNPNATNSLSPASIRALAEPYGAQMAITPTLCSQSSSVRYENS